MLQIFRRFTKLMCPLNCHFRFWIFKTWNSRKNNYIVIDNVSTLNWMRPVIKAGDFFHWFISFVTAVTWVGRRERNQVVNWILWNDDYGVERTLFRDFNVYCAERKLLIYKQWRIQDFLGEGIYPRGKDANLLFIHIFCQKLHENKRRWISDSQIQRHTGCPIF